MCVPFNPDPVISLLGIYSKEITLGVCKDLLTKMLIMTLFTIAAIGEKTNSQQKKTGLKKTMHLFNVIIHKALIIMLQKN